MSVYKHVNFTAFFHYLTLKQTIRPETKADHGSVLAVRGTEWLEVMAATRNDHHGGPHSFQTGWTLIIHNVMRLSAQ